MAIYKNRREAGRELAKHLNDYAGKPEVVVLGLPRGGVPVAFEVAEALHAPLDVFVVRKLGAPGQEELAMGAIASGGVRWLNDAIIRKLDVPPEVIEGRTEKELREIARREQQYVGNRPRPELKGKQVILVDDGLATGASMYAAVAALREHAPQRVVVAVPVASPRTCEEFRDVVEDIVCAETPEPFLAVGAWYADFSQTTDEEVRELLHLAAAPKSWT